MATLTAPVVGGTGKVELAAEVFGHETHRQLLYEAVRAEMLARRQGTSQTKTRGQVAGDIADAILGIGISTPGPLNPWRGVVLETPNMGPKFVDVPVAAGCMETVSGPAVSVGGW